MTDLPFLAPPKDFQIKLIIKQALHEDLGLAGDISADACLLPNSVATAQFVARTRGVVAGWCAAKLAAHLVDTSLALDIAYQDGQMAKANTVLATLHGSTKSVLMAERVMLNFLTHLSGIASLTKEFVQQVEGSHAKIADTRKTLPGLRLLQKYAVRCGGGVNHRFGLFDAIMIKDNHVAAAGSIAQAIFEARKNAGHMVKIEVEIDQLEQLDPALDSGADIIMLDNFSLEDLKIAVQKAQSRAILEASGGVTLDKVGAIARTGVDIISVGALTHSAPALDIGLDFHVD